MAEMYIISAFGRKIDNKYVKLPPKVRVIMQSDPDRCETEKVYNSKIIETLITPINDNLEVLKQIWESTNHQLCIYSGNLNKDFSHYYPTCKDKEFNIVPNIHFYSSKNKVITDGFYKIPLELEESNINYSNIKNIFPLIESKNFNVKSYNKQISESLGVLDLESIINTITSGDNFNESKNFVTIIIPKCIIENNDNNTNNICKLSISDYTSKKINFADSNGLNYNSIAEYDLKLATNNFVESYQDLISKYDYTFVHPVTGYTDEYSEITNNPVRAYRDVSTDSFVKTILSNDKIRYLFLDYTFHMINSIINVNINKYLIENNYKPIQGNESFFLIFKGGNVMNYFLNNKFKLIEPIFENVKMNIVSKYCDDNNYHGLNDIDTFKEYFSTIEDKFKISDVDYSIYIDADDYTRYTIIYNYILIILADILETISVKFDNLFNDMFNNNKYTQPDFIVDTVDDIGDTINIEADYNILKKLISNENYNKTICNYEFGYNKYCLDLSSAIIKSDKFIKNLSQKIDNIENFRKIYDLVEHIKYVQTIGYLRATGAKISDPSPILGKLESYLQIMLDTKFFRLVENNFYEKDGVDNILKNIIDGLSDHIGSKKFEDKQDDTGINTFIKTYVLNRKPELYDLKYTKRSNSIVKSDCSFKIHRSVIVSDKKYNHYISFNNTIKKVRKYDTRTFSLMRIKFNIELVNGAMKIDDIESDISIPSEFIDVSIPMFGDTSSKDFVLKSRKYVTKISLQNSELDNNVVIQCYGMADLIHDLQSVLFDQNFMPWIDKKYSKRLTRLIVLSVLESYLADYRDCGNTHKKLDKFKDIVKLSSSIYTYIKSNMTTEYPYQICKKFIKSENRSTEYTMNILDDIKYRYLTTNNLILIDDIYEDNNLLISFLIVFSKILSFDIVTQFNIMSVLRENNLLSPIREENFKKYMADCKEKFLELLLVIINDGYNLLFVFENLLKLVKYYKD